MLLTLPKWIILGDGGMEVLDETEKAYFVLVFDTYPWLDGRQLWIPKSAVRVTAELSKYNSGIIVTAKILPWFVKILRKEYAPTEVI